MKSVVGWLAGSLWGGNGQQQQQQRNSISNDVDESMSDEQHAAASLDDTINYEEENNRTSANTFPASTSSFAFSPSSPRSSSRLPASPSHHHHHPAAAAASSVSPTTAAFIAQMAGNSARSPFRSPGNSGAKPTQQRLSFGMFSPSTTVPSVFSATPAPNTTVSSAFFSPGFNQSQQAAAAAATTTAAPATPDALLRSAFTAFTPSDSSRSIVALDQLVSLASGNSGNEVDIDALVLSLANRTVDSRHLQEQQLSGEEEQVLVTELRSKAARFEMLLQFLLSPLISASPDPAQSSKNVQRIPLWNCLSHTSQSQVMQFGELLECALALKQLLNTAAASLVRPTEDGTLSTVAEVSDTDKAQVATRRELMFDCMTHIVHVQRLNEDAPALLREGLSVQEIFFSEPSRLSELFTALKVVFLGKEELQSAFSQGTVVQQSTLLRLHAGVELIQCILAASSAFRSNAAHAALFASITLPAADQNPFTSWILSQDVSETIHGIVNKIQLQLEDLRSKSAALKEGMHLTVAATVAGKAGSTPVTGFNLPIYQASLFDQAYRVTRVYLGAYTEFLTKVDVMRQKYGDLAANVNEYEEQFHTAFVKDRLSLLQLLTSAAYAISQQNQRLTSVAPDLYGKPGVETPKIAPYPPMYELSQEFQDFTQLVNLSLSEPERATADKRLIFYFVQYGFAFLREIFDQMMERKTMSRLVELAPVATAELPSYASEALARSGTSLAIPDSNGEPVEIGVDGLSTEGVHVYDAWLKELLTEFPQYAWVHELYMEQYEDASKILRSEARLQKKSIVHKKHLLSLSKLAFLVSNDTTEFTLGRNNSDSSMASSATASSDSNVHRKELHQLDDELNLINIQQWLGQQLHQLKDESQQIDTDKVFTPSALFQSLLRIGSAQPASATAAASSAATLVKLQSFLFAFEVLEKCFLLKPRATMNEYSSENQSLVRTIWSEVLQSDGSERWNILATLKKRDASEEWKEQLGATIVTQTLKELFKRAAQGNGYIDVYSQTFQQLVLTPSALPAAFQSNDTRVLFENAYQLAKEQASSS